MAHDVFISYSTGDKPTADAICAFLEAEAVRCWIAPRDVTPGLPYAPAIVDAIRKAPIVVLVFSSKANRSSHVLREIERAASFDKIIVPFRIEDTTPSHAIEYYLSVPHWLDALTPPLTAHLTRLRTTVLSLLDKPLDALAEPEAPLHSARRRPFASPRRPSRLSALVLATALAVLVGFSALWLRKPSVGPEGGGDGAEVETSEVRFTVWSAPDETRSIEDHFAPGDQTLIRYRARMHAGALIVEPDSEYLKTLAKRGPIEPVSGDGPFFQLDFPKLDLHLVNNSGKSLVVARAYLEVAESRLDRSPLLMTEWDPEKLFQFRLSNQGWGLVEDCRLRFQIYDWSQKEDLVARSFPRVEELLLTRGPFDFAEQIDLDISDELRELGVDTDAMNRLYARFARSGRDLESPTVKDQILRALGPFARSTDIALVEDPVYGPWNRKVLIAGLVTYSSSEPSSASKQERIRFFATSAISPPEGVGGAGYETGHYAVLLAPQKKKYREEVSISRHLSDGEADSFSIRVGAPMSSFHELRVRLILSEEPSIVSNPVRLHLLVPRTNAAELPAAAGVSPQGGSHES